MCPSRLGRIHTRVATLIGPAILATILSFATGNPGWIVTIGILLLLGTVLDIVFYPFVIKWQPPWLTFVLAVGEFVLLFMLVQLLDPGNGNPGFGVVQAIVLYWVSWLLVEFTRIVVFPLLSLSWVENGGEFRITGWSIQPEVEPLPVVAIFAPNQADDPLVSQLSGSHDQPIQRQPPLSGVYERPTRA